MNRPNVLLIVTDQFRGDLLTDSLLGQVAKLPRLRELMGEATTFDQHFSVVAPCGPSRVSLLTGQYAINHRSVRNGTPLRKGTPNLATAARAAGYNPKLFGYTDTSVDPTGLDPSDPNFGKLELFVQGLGYDTTESSLRAFFEPYGSLTKCKLF